MVCDAAHITMRPALQGDGMRLLELVSSVA